MRRRLTAEAERLGVSARTLYRAQVVAEKRPDLIEDLKWGRLTVNAAYRQVRAAARREENLARAALAEAARRANGVASAPAHAEVGAEIVDPNVEASRKVGGGGMNRPAVYETSPINRTRRTRAEIEGLRIGLYEIVRDLRPVTVRQVFYQAVSRGLVAKTEREYKNVVARLLVAMRRGQVIPYAWVTDATRWMRKPETYRGLEHALHDMARYYRRALWAELPVAVELWCEKDALAGILYDVTSEYDVPLMVGRGFSSLSYLHSAAEQMRDAGKPVHVYYFADHDPSGLTAMRVAERELRTFAPDVELSFHHAAVTWEQVERWNLPTRPTKRTDSRAKRYGNKPSVELDAIPPDLLRALARECIEPHIDPDVLGRLRRIEDEERRALAQLALSA